MPNVFLSGRIPAELNQQVDEFLARTGETKTEMLTKAVAAYIGAEPPPLKATGDRRIENLEQEVALLKGAVKSLYEKLATLTSKTETPKVENEPISTFDNTTDNTDNIEKIDKLDHTFSNIDNTVDNSDNHVEIEKANSADNVTDNSDNISGVTCPTEVTPAINDDKTFLKIETAEVARLTKLDAKKFTNLRYSFNQKFKKQNQPFPENEILDCPIKMTPSSGVKIAKTPYDVFYVGQSKEGKHLWNLVPENTPGEQIPLVFPADNRR
jgi:hypothetical protein